MEFAARPHTQASHSPTHSGLFRSIAKLVRLHRRSGSRGGSGDDDDDSRTTATGRTFFFKPSRLKQSGPLDGSSGYARSEAVREEDVKRQNRGRETSDTVIAMVFAGVSAIKAAYAQLQLAQAPYDPEAVQAADLAVVAELKRISQIKHWYFGSKQQHLVSGEDNNNMYYHQMQVQMLSPDAHVVAEILEMRSLIKTYQVTTKKLENELKRKDEEVARLGEELKVAEEQKNEFEQKLRALMVSAKKNNATSTIHSGGGGAGACINTNATNGTTTRDDHHHHQPQLQRRHHYRSLSSSFSPFCAMDDQIAAMNGGKGGGVVDLERLSPGLFMDSLRRAFRSARAFTRELVREMQTAGWDVSAAAAAIVPDVAIAADDDYLELVLQSYICRRMFTAFQYPQFKAGREKSKTCDIRRRRERFLEEFEEMEQQQLGWGKLDGMGRSYFHGSSAFEEFIRDKYRTVVHPRMEAAFFGGEAGLGLSFPSAAAATAAPRHFFRCFHEMARRVWMLQRLFHAFEPEAGASLFEAPKGCRFSEVHMQSILPAAAAQGQGLSLEMQMTMVVGFTVVPGFKLRGTVIPCRVYLVREDGTTTAATNGW